MANEVLYAGLADQRTTETLAGEVLYLLADRTALPAHPALFSFGTVNGSGSLTKKLPFVGLGGYDLLQPIGDGAVVPNTALSDSSVTVAVSRWGKAYEPTDSAKLTDPSNVLSKPSFAADAVQAYLGTLTNAVANVTDDYVSTVGTTTVKITLANFLAARAVLQVAKNVGPFLALLYTQQWADLQSALSTASGVIQFTQATLEMISKYGPGYQGSFLGVDIFASAYVPTANAGADSAGGMFGRGAVAWADGLVPDEGDPNMMNLGKVAIERQRTGDQAKTKYISHAYLGVAKGLDASGVSIITKR